MSLIALDHLQPHPGNANRMAPKLFAKLVEHIRMSGEYPALIVRAMPAKSSAEAADDSERFEILDGHHRADALRRLGHEHAKCEIWDVDDERALMLLLTLNRLRGEDDPQRRGALLKELARGKAIHTVAELVPDDAERIEKLIAISDAPPPLKPPAATEDLLQAITFFLNTSQLRRLSENLNAVCRDRSMALARLLNLNDC